MKNKRRHPRTNRIMAEALVLFSILVLAIAGCDKLKRKEVTEIDKGSAESAEGDKKPSGPCEQYAEMICKVTSETSPTCRSMKSLTDIMPEAACKAGMNDIEYTKKKITEMRAACDKLASNLCKDIGPETDTCEMVKTQVAKLPPERCEQMMKQYPKIVADLKRREAANKPLSPEQQKTIFENAKAVFGPKDAKVQIIEFSDFQCPYSSRAAKVAAKIKEKYSDKVRFVYRHFPLSFHKNAHAAAEASMAAGAQGKFWEYHDLVFENQRAVGRADLEKYAERLKLDMKSFKKALDDKTYEKAVDADIKLGEKVFVSGTPTLFLNGKRLRNPTDFDLVSKEIEKALN
jgi:protein-disulfide isomerase